MSFKKNGDSADEDENSERRISCKLSAEPLE
jgi:hypothetical protein